ncbi:MAG: carboxy terminal-processing peptidase [Verrucomicrobiales bacterium]|jgi:carboxyl-terminal processing protease|nr:carboxy terminal-processing peptidase [Verrucomicrobiales bacterium]
MFSAKFLKTASLVLLASSLLRSAPAQDVTQYGDLAQRVVTMLEEEHFLREPFNDTMSKRVLTGFLEYLDYSRIYFTKEDIDSFTEKYETKIDDQVRNGGIPAAFEIFSIYEERVRDRVELAKKLAVPNSFTYDSDRTVEISRKESPWVKAGEERDQLWRNLIEGDLIREMQIVEAVAKKKKEDADKRAKAGLAPKKEKEDAESKKSIYEKVSDRYDRSLKRIKENTTEDVATLFLKAVAAAYDPHSEYFSQQQYDNFRISMNKSLTGIGAMLQKDEDQGGATIEGLVVGGPAFKAGKLGVKDRVIGVAQGPDGEFVDTVDMKLSDIVDLIRGEIGSMVRLKIIPANKTDEIEFVDITREQIDLKDSLATADLIITKDPEGKEEKLGWITLPSFYADMDGGQTSTTADVRRLLTRLSIEGISGLIVDLRDNGGGSLEEAINMTGLFIRKGPVVQSIDWRGERDQKFSRNGEAVYGGPMIVLINRASASASEIFAAALQDYGRAVIVGGESTFGKGTVQQLRPVLSNRIVLPFNRETKQEGALKLTIQTFYRINGHSTQRHGVVPEVRLPSMLDIAEIGEASLPNALVVDPIEPSKYLPFFNKPIDFESLQRSSEPRIASGTDFKYILKDINEEKQRIERNTISLNMQKRKDENATAEAERNERKKDRIALFNSLRESEKGLFTIYKLTQDNVIDEKLVLRDSLSEEDLSGMTKGATEEEEDPDDKLLEYPHKLDPYARETLRILQDLIAIGKTGKPVNISEAKPEARAKTIPVEVRPTQPN